ncbi:hypothetical protein MMC28_006898 [Mycoblastus sanguinarius]|nr:hypothetical protein [Mycoblastus sanguinarius]
METAVLMPTTVFILGLLLCLDEEAGRGGDDGRNEVEVERLAMTAEGSVLEVMRFVGRDELKLDRLEGKTAEPSNGDDAIVDIVGRDELRSEMLESNVVELVVDNDAGVEPAVLCEVAASEITPMGVLGAYVSCPELAVKPQVTG